MTDRELARALRDALPPCGAAPPRDLWPRMRARLERGHTPVSWLDWALAAAVMLGLLLAPEALPGLLYHL